jgi:hypothetical protein
LSLSGKKEFLHALLHKDQGGLMPTLKAEEFCQAFYTWAEACQTELPTDDENQKQWRKEFADH